VEGVGATNYSATGKVQPDPAPRFSMGPISPQVRTSRVRGGGAAVYPRNEHGSLIKLIAADPGLKFELSAGGVNVALVN
jgi:hypothetical protein